MWAIIYMLSGAEIFVIAVAVGTLAVHAYNRFFAEVTTVKASKDGREYIVKDLSDKDQAAERLAALNAILADFVRRLRDKHPDDPRVARVAKRYSPDRVSEGAPSSGYTSYSVNKGESIVVCIRQTDNSFVDMNDVLYVVIHELAHLSTDEIGHTDTFWNNFRFLLQEAQDMGVYKRRDYGRQPADYCGIRLTSSVLAGPQDG